MSPEQVRARPDAIDHRTDVYSLGVTLYELLTLRPAFEGTRPGQIIERVERNPPLAPRRIRPSIPIDLETIVEKAISKEPSRRYTTAAELAADLTRFLEDRPVLARRSSVARKSLQWVRRHRAWCGAGTVVLVAVVTIALVLLSARQRSLEESYAAELERLSLAFVASEVQRPSSESSARWQRGTLPTHQGTDDDRERELLAVIDAFRGLSRRLPARPEAYYWRGRAQLSSARPGDAVRSARMAIHRDASFLPARVLAAVAGTVERSAADSGAAEASLALEESNAWLRDWIEGELALRRGEWKLAADRLTPVCDRFYGPSPPSTRTAQTVFLARGRAWLELGEYDRAIEDFVVVWTLAPRAEFAALLAAKAYLGDERFDAARRFLAEIHAASREPNATAARIDRLIASMEAEKVNDWREVDGEPPGG